MHVVKQFGLCVLLVMAFCLVSCTTQPTTAEQVRNIDYKDYGSLNDNRYGYRLEDFMIACRSVMAFQKDVSIISAECNGWQIQIETYMAEPNLDNSCWCTQILLSKEGNPSKYVFGHVKGAMPRVMSQPEQVLVCDSSLQPWKHKLEKSSLEDLLELMTSGNLWEDREDPLAGLSFSYVEKTASGTKIAHRPDGTESVLTTDSIDF